MSSVRAFGVRASAWIRGASPFSRSTRAQQVAREDWRLERSRRGRRFSLGTRPVMRWIKGDGLDDAVTRAAIGQATRLFGTRVDYCLCTQGIDAARARSVLEWAAQPVEWWPVSPEDNPVLARRLQRAGCAPPALRLLVEVVPRTRAPRRA